MYRIVGKFFIGITFLSSISLGDMNVKICSAALAAAAGGSLTLTQVEPTDLRGLPGAALAQIVKSLKNYWIQIETHDPISTFGNAAGENHYLIKVMGTGQGIRFGQYVMTVIGGAGDAKTTEIFLNDITSIQLVDVPEITVSLVNKIDEKNVTVN